MIDIAILEKLAPVQVGMSFAELDQPARELQQLDAALVQLPIEPADLVVLAVGVVVAVLGAADLVAAAESWARLAKEAGWPENCASGARGAAMISGSSVGPSAPMFQEWLSLVPSRLSSPLASLCLSL